jgi:hypothetical protein
MQLRQSEKGKKAKIKMALQGSAGSGRILFKFTTLHKD